MKNLFAVATATLFYLACCAQGNTIDTSYTLLWYKGAKLKPNVLLTPRKDTVRYDAAKSQVKVSSKAGPGKQLDEIRTELNRSPQRMQEMANRLKAGLPKTVVPYYVRMVNESYTKVQQEFNPCLNNTLDIPSADFAKKTATTAGRGPSVNYELDGQTFEEALAEVLEYYARYKDEKISFVPTPPRRELTYCAMVDKDAEAIFERDFEQFRKELVGKDAEIFQLFLKLTRHSQFYFDDNAKIDLNNKLEPLKLMLLKRQHEKVLLLIDQYGGDPYRCWSLLRISMLVDRNLTLLGWYEEQPEAKCISWAVLETITTTWSDFLKKSMLDYDYSIALNFRALLGMERIAQLHDTKAKMPFYELLRFNRFKLNMHVSAKISANGGYQLAELRGDNWFSAIPDSTGRLVWILIGPLVNKISVDLTAAEFRGKIDFPYAGTRKWQSPLPKMKLDFCNSPGDTLDVYMFYAEDHKETWILPPPTGATELLVVSGLLGNTFLDINRIRETQQELKNDPQAIEKMKKEMLARLEQMKKTGAMPNVAAGKDASLNQLAFAAEMNRMTNEMMQSNRKYDPLKFVFKPEPRNRSPIVLQEKMNGKELFPQNAATEYAWFHLKLEQDPNCPYEVNF